MITLLRRCSFIGMVLAQFCLIGCHESAHRSTTKPAVVETATQLDKAASIPFDPKLSWGESGWAGDINANHARYSDKGEYATFTVDEPNKRCVWVWYGTQPVDPTIYPWLVVRYRARNIHPEGAYVLWLDDTRGPNNGGIYPFNSNALICDGQIHEFRADLRAHSPAGHLTGMALGVHAADAVPAEFELVELRFDSDPGVIPPVVDHPQKKPITITVKDERGAAVAGARVTLDADRLDLVRMGTTDADGKLSLAPADDSVEPHSMFIDKSGMTRHRERKVDAGQTIEIVLDQTETLSGRVVDEEGKPVEGATVSFSIDRETRGPIAPRPPAAILTDSNGRWKQDGFPASAVGVRVAVAKAGYLSDRWGGQYSGATPLTALRDGSAKSILKRGVTLSGIVRDHQGNPVADALVALGEDRFPSNAPPATNTDSAGKFHFDGLSPTPQVLTVSAAKNGPAQLKVDPSGQNTLEITLPEPHVMRVRVVDEKGQPLAGAFVGADTWRGYRALTWSTTTDADGWATWNEAPEDDVQYSIFIKDRMSLRKQVLPPDTGDTQVVTLLPVLKISGSVTDAETGQGIEDFKVVYGLSFQRPSPQNQISWESEREGTTRTGNRYELTRSYPYPYHFVKIESPGYIPAISDPFTSDRGSVTYDFKLKRGDSISGFVHDANGQAVGGAIIAIAGPQQQLMIAGGKSFESGNNEVFRSDDKGAFTLPPRESLSQYRLIALHAEGYADIALQDGVDKIDVPLTTWGTIKGRAWIGDKPAVNTDISLQPQDRATGDHQVFWHFDVRTDADGNFIFDRAPAGTLQLAPMVKIGESMSAPSGVTRVKMEPGQHMELTLGGQGRPVIGRLDLPASLPEWVPASARISTKIDVKRPTFPENFVSMTNEEKKAWSDQWMASDEGKAYLEASAAANERRNYFAVIVEKDGTFHADDILPGMYNLQVELNAPLPGMACGFGEQLASATTTFEVADIPGGRTSEPLDIGTVPVTSMQSVAVGAMAPEFEVQTLDGGAIKLSDYKGKYVLIDFWAT